MIDLNEEMAWVTFLHDGWETKWHPVTSTGGHHFEFDSEVTMEFCRAHFGNVTFGIAPTSQMIINNSVRDNM